MDIQIPGVNEIIFKDDFVVKSINTSLADEYVYHAAKVSVLGGDVLELEEKKGISGLIKYLIKNRHGTPFEHNSITFFISAPIFVFREFMRHRIGFSYNEESGRYTILKPVFYLPNDQRALVQIGKIGHYNLIQGEDKQRDLLKKHFKELSISSYKKYVELLEANIAREIARMVLPVNLYSSMYVTCNARSLMSFLSLRTTSENSQFQSFPMKEIEGVGVLMEKELKKHMPITHAAFVQYGRVAP